MRFEPDKHLHSREHVLADDLSRQMREPKHFAAYLGIAKLYYESDLRALAKYVREKYDRGYLPPEARGKYFFAAIKGLQKKPGVKFKNLKKKRTHKEKMSEIKPIVKEPHKVLRKKAAEVPLSEIKSPQIQRLIYAMKETLKSTPDGVGLAAPQIGKSLQIFIVSEEAEEIDKAEKGGWNRREQNDPAVKNDKPYENKEWKYYVFINPEVKNKSRKKLEGPEGCLSVPGKFGSVKRHEKITVAAHNEQGKKFTRGASRFFARVIQHELDHLEGALFVDKAERIIENAPMTK